MQKIYLVLLFVVITLSVNAQIGTIKGQIKDEKTGEGIIGGNVVIEGTTIGSSTDVDGSYIISKVKAGKYNLVITYVSYKTKTIQGIEVYPDQTTVVNTSIQEDAMELDAITITSKRQTDTDISVITELKKADLVAVGISSQQIKLSQDRDAAQVIRRVPGVTIVGNRFVNVRGLSERYSTVMLNGIIAPSTEVDSKAFAFDLIPSNMLERMLVYKSGSAELPGEFAGADVSIFTKNIVEENSTSFSISGSFRSNTTGQDAVLSSETSGTDFLGNGNSIRRLPNSFPQANLRSLSLGDPTQASVLTNASQSLPNNWGFRNISVAPDLRLNFDLARVVRLGKRKLENVTSISYASSNQRLESVQNLYEDNVSQGGASIPRNLFNDILFTQTNRIGAISNFTFEFNPSNRIEFRNFYNQQGQNQSTVRTGKDFPAGSDVSNLALSYFNRTIYSGQLSGKHSFSDAVNFNWILGYNNVTAEQPDYRRIRSTRAIGTNDPFRIAIPGSATTNDAGRFYSKLQEQTYSFVGNLEIKLNPEKPEAKQIKLITGYYFEQKERTFSARWFSYNYLNSVDFGTRQSLSLLPFGKIFSPENIGSVFILNEGTNIGPGNFDRYDGHNQLLAGYAGIVTPLGEKFRLSTGVRVESNVQQIDVYSGLEETKIRKVDSPITVPMPFLNLSYNITEKMLARLAYSKTVNRPVFRELAPFLYYDFDKNVDIYGNPDLTTAKIDNFDVSWELYPSPSQKFSIGFFYKNFQNPIEQYIASGAGNLVYSYLNAEKADNYGVEVELRKSLENLSSSFLKKLTFVFNGSLIDSKITLPSRYITLSKERALQGQSPYVANASIYYNDFAKGLQISLQYNVFGKRIFAVGDNTNSDRYEMPRNQIDLTVTKQLNRHLELKFGIQDILNQPYQIIEDSNRDQQITDIDQTIQKNTFGQYTTLGLAWKF